MQASVSQDTMANAVIQIVEKENVLAATIVLYLDSKDILQKQIEGMRNDLYSDVLYAKYVVGMSFNQISLILNRSRRQTINIVNSAIGEFEKQYGSEYKNL